MLVVAAGSVTSVSFVQFAKALSPILVTRFGMRILVSAGIWQKHSVGILVKPVPSVTSANALSPENAPVPSEVTVRGIVMDFRLTQL